MVITGCLLQVSLEAPHMHISHPVQPGGRHGRLCGMPCRQSFPGRTELVINMTNPQHDTTCHRCSFQKLIGKLIDDLMSDE